MRARGPFCISVVIPTYQRCASVRRGLEALARQTLAATEYEVIVPIDGSDDGTKEMIDQFPAPYRLTATWQPNQGRAAARNAGIRKATGDLIVLLDDDMEPAPGCLLAHRDAHPPGSRRAVVGAVPIPIDASSPPIVQYRHAGMNAHLLRLAQPGYKPGFRDIYSGNLSVPRAVALEVGGFDETFKLYGHEDYEFALRLLRADVELAYSAEAVAYQRYDKDLAALAQDCVARGHTAVLFALKHPDVASSLKLATYRDGSLPWRLLRSLLLWLSRWLASVPAGVIGFMQWLERRRPGRLHQYYTLALDYFFWVGARSASRGISPPEPGTGGRAGSPQPITTVKRMTLSDPVRMRIGLCLVVVFALVSDARLARRARHALADVSRTDDVARQEARFRELRQELPLGTPVGYITDPAPRGVADDGQVARLAFQRYVLTQYALLPAIVLPGTDGPLVVGDFYSPRGVDSAVTRGLTPIRNFGNGVLLLRTSSE